MQDRMAWFTQDGAKGPLDAIALFLQPAAVNFRQTLE